MKRILFLLATLFFQLFAHAMDVVVAAHDPGYYTSLARHAQRWLSTEGVVTDLATPNDLGEKLKDAKVAVLIGFDAPTEKTLNVISNFRERGGRLIVFYSSSPRLAQMMGVKVVGFTKADYPGKWSEISFSVKFPEGLPRLIRQTSTVLQRAVPIKGRARVMATWRDRKGRDTRDAAWLSSSAGYWMTHVFLADGDEALKARTLAVMIGCLAPQTYSLSKATARDKEEKEKLELYAKQQKPNSAEIRAVWEHSGCGLYPGDWKKTFEVLKKANITDLFVNVAGAGFAHYPSDVLPRSAIFSLEGDQLAACLSAAKDSGVRVHAWLLCFSATRASANTLEKFRAKDWCLYSKDKKVTEYLDPSNKDIQKYILKAIDEIQTRYPSLSGIHLDFVRWYERAEKPKNAAVEIASFVAAARARVKRPLWLTTAVLGKYPQCIESVGQDWESWLRIGIVDYVVPMDYTEDLSRFEVYLKQHSKKKANAKKIIVGIGVTANESRLNARLVIDQIKLVRKYGLAGVALFDLDRTLEVDILPILKLGLW